MVFGHGAGRRADVEEAARHLPARADLDDGAVFQLVQIEGQGFWSVERLLSRLRIESVP